MQPFTAKQVRDTKGSDREEWIESLAKEVQNLRDLGVIREVTRSELTAIKPSEILPCKVVLGLKDGSRKKARMCVCGNFSDKTDQTLFTSQVDIGVLRMMLQIAEVQKWHIIMGDVEAAFLQGEFRPGAKKRYARMPKLQEEFQLVPPGTVVELLMPHVRAEGVAEGLGDHP